VKLGKLSAAKACDGDADRNNVATYELNIADWAWISDDNIRSISKGCGGDKSCGSGCERKN
jgi:hypothetical protein